VRDAFNSSDITVDDRLASVVPIGAVVAFGGTVAPAGWHLCNGTAHGSTALQAVTGSPNAPDLRDRFIVAAGATYAQNATGGAAAHTHAATGLWAHLFTSAADLWMLRKNGTPSWNSSHTIKGASGAGAAVASTTGTEISGATAAASSLPPYYALTYIIRKG